jgi:hypothetical protein
MEPAYIATLSRALARRLKGAEISHEHVRGDRYRFVVLWDQFEKIEHPERQEKVWDIADRSLKKDDLRKVTMILTLGPDDLASESR